ncbi:MULTISPECIES: LysR substrate-binding domain-containing protein [unclassified Beijerinckia]|uniref:LysR substrate-binding domain-containing protein n=1 Tax=unclassified Beijerinckia TaxID=2638183 RepID=UPI001FCE0F8E|nr:MULTISPECIES: LysR substrate-binding domain-containing protein [unclassified Beijerinckia]
MRSQAAELIGQVGLGFPPSIGILFVGKILSDCIARYPHLKLFLQEDFSPAVRDALLSGRIDIGIMSSEAQHPDLVGEPLFTESMWLIGRPEDWPIKGRRLGLDKLDRLPIVIGSFTRLLLERLQARSNFQLRVVAEVDSLTTAIGALRAGAGFLVVPFSSVDRELQKKELVGAPIDGFAITRSLFRHRDRPPTRASTALTGLIHDEVSRLISSQPDVFRRFRAS